MFEFLGKYLVIFGVVLVLVGGLLILAGRLPYIGKLPGDILIRRTNFTFYFPITTCILISILASIILYLFSRK